MISCKIPNRKSEPLTMILISNIHTDYPSYDFEYEDGDEDQEGDVDVENKYYNAKQMKSESPDEAIDEFLGVPALEPEKGEW
jgi:COP9 signalosome complex subunit 2